MPPPSHSYIARTRACASPARLIHRSTASAIVVGAAAAAILGSAYTSAEAAENSTRIEREHHACAIVMGLPQPGELYDACVRSLNDSLSELDRAKLISTDRDACSKEKLRPGTPAFADCVLDAEKAPAAAR